MKIFIAGVVSLFALSCHGQAQRTLNKQVQEALKKAKAYFESKGSDIPEKAVVIGLFMLSEHFEYPIDLPPLEVFKANYPELGESNIMLHGKYFEGRRIPSLGDSEAMGYLKKNVNTIDGLNFWSMYCDRYPLPDTIIKLLDRNIDKGDYFMIYTALQLANMLKLGCLKDGPEISELKSKLKKELVLEITTERTGVSEDLRYQSMAMLYYLGADNLVTNAFIQRVVDDQLPDGGWSAYSQMQASHELSSIFALWTLLEYHSRHD